MTLFSVSRENK